MALGNSYPEMGGKNVSALHWDMICDLRAAAGGGEVWVDEHALPQRRRARAPTVSATLTTGRSD